MVGLNGHEFQQTLGDSEGQGGLVCCSPWGSKEMNNNRLFPAYILLLVIHLYLNFAF